MLSTTGFNMPNHCYGVVLKSLILGKPHQQPNPVSPCQTPKHTHHAPRTKDINKVYLSTKLNYVYTHYIHTELNTKYNTWKWFSSASSLDPARLLLPRVVLKPTWLSCFFRVCALTLRRTPPALLPVFLPFPCVVLHSSLQLHHRKYTPQHKNTSK